MDIAELETGDNIPEKIESDAVKKLLEYEGKKLFHGSINGSINGLEPRQAHDTDPTKEFNNAKAVYATRTPAEAVIIAVVDADFAARSSGKSDSWSTHNYKDKIKARIPKEWESVVKKGTGSVYVLPLEKFTEFHGPHGKCKETVVPDDRVEVTYHDYLNLGGEIEWK